MTNSLIHRGPDNTDTWNDAADGVYFGHRRLSIIDLSDAGKQPMHSNDGRYTVTYNGEIYNYKDIRVDLETNYGVNFTNNTDTQVLLEACNIYGIKEALDKFIGMFAIALWDKHKKLLYMARDRVGKKPLYWGYINGDVVFASELKAINKYPGFNKTLDTGSIANFLKYGYINAPESIFKDIYKVEPGTVITIQENKCVAIEKYWNLDSIVSSENQFVQNGQTTQDELEKLLNDAVCKRMISDVPIGVMLSGGIDSSLVTALMQSQSTNKIKSYSIGFHEKQYDESTHAKKIAQHLGTDHNEFHVDASTALDVLGNIPDIYDEPFADASQIPTYIISQLLRKEVTVALSGDGGDEVFAGYSRYFWGQKFSDMNNIVPLKLRALFSKLIHSIPPYQIDSIFSMLPGRIRPSHSGERMHKIANILKVKNDSEIYSKLVSQWQPSEIMLSNTNVNNIDLMGYPGEYDIISAMQYSDLNTYLPGDILVKVDRASMANSLEVRSPLLDHRVIEYAWKLDKEQKINRGKGKYILREILYKHVPAKLIDRPKMGFGVPISSWLRGPLKEWANDLLAVDRIKQQNLFRPDPIREVLDTHMSKQRNYQYPLWTMLMFQLWYDRWVT